MSPQLLKSVRRADRIVERLVEMEAASVSELAEEFEIPLSTMYEYVNTLESINYITKRSDGRYRVSSSFLEVGNRVLRNHDVYAVAEPETVLTLLIRYADSFGEGAAQLAADADSLLRYDP